jgi:mannitol-1-phosphate 5-dehydrogenase
MNGLRAVVFGAGKMACGLLGQLLTQSGFATMFVARRPEVSNAINRQNGYSLIVAGDDTDRLAIRNCSALLVHETRRVAEAVAGADVIFTAVGIDNIAPIAPAISEGLWKRSRSHCEALNVIACENLPGAGAYLEHQILSVSPLKNEMEVKRIGGFSAALTRRIMNGGAIENGEMTFTVDPDYDLTIDALGLKGRFPHVQGATLTQEFSALVMRKLFILNCAQAVAAYLGYRERCRYIHEAAAHYRVAPIIQDAVTEAQIALTAEFPSQAEAIKQDGVEALARIANPRLADPINRVARDPRRKLSSRERLVGPARLASKHNLRRENLCLAVAAALTYDEATDPQAVAMQRAIAAGGLETVLTEDCGLLPHEELAHEVKQQWRRLTAQSAISPISSLEAFSCIRTSVEHITRGLAQELSQRYDPTIVNDILARVGEEFQQARIVSYLPILMKRTALERLRVG